MAGSVQLCPLVLIAHVPCPACGLTRATLALLHGDVAEAVRFHPLAPVAVPFLALYVGARTLWEIARGTPARGRWEEVCQRILAVLAVSAVIVWAARFFGAFGGPVPV